MASIAEVTKAVSSIAQEELGKMGTSIDDTTTKTGQLAAKWENAKAQIGKAINEQTKGIYAGAEALLDYAAKLNFVTQVAKAAVSGVFKSEGSGSFANAMLDINQALKDQKWALDDVARIYEVFNPTVNKSITTLGGLKEKLAELQKEFEETDVTTGRFRELRNEIQKLQDQISKLTNPEKILPKAEKVEIAVKGLREMNVTLIETGNIVKRATEQVNTLSTAWEYSSEKLGIFHDLAGTLGQVLQDSFNAALTNGESFFKTFIDGLKKMVQQIVATIAAAAVLSVILKSLGIPGLKGASFGQVFQGVYKQMGGFGSDQLNFASFAPGALTTTGGGAGRTVLRGNDIFVSNSRSGIDISRIGG
jgi:phage shock protein A